MPHSSLPRVTDTPSCSSSLFLKRQPFDCKCPTYSSPSLFPLPLAHAPVIMQSMGFFTFLQPWSSSSPPWVTRPHFLQTEGNVWLQGLSFHLPSWTKAKAFEFKRLFCSIGNTPQMTYFAGLPSCLINYMSCWFRTLLLGPHHARVSSPLDTTTFTFHMLCSLSCQPPFPCPYPISRPPAMLQPYYLPGKASASLLVMLFPSPALDSFL